MDPISLQGAGQLSQVNQNGLLQDALEAQQSALSGDAEEAAAKFESLLATTLVKEMRKALPEGGFFGKSVGADVFNGWLDEHIGGALARSGALDLAGMIKTSIGNKQAEQVSLEETN